MLASSPVTPSRRSGRDSAAAGSPSTSGPSSAIPIASTIAIGTTRIVNGSPPTSSERIAPAGHDREPEQAADDSETLPAERRVAKRLARADTSGAERRRDHGALSEDKPDRERDEHGNDARVRPQPVGCDASLDEHGRDRPGGENAGHAARETREDREDESFRGDHPPHLAWGRSDRPEERELTPALGDHQAEDAGDDEDRDRASVAGEYRHHGDHRVALFGAGVARVRGRGVVPARDLVPGSERRSQPIAQAVGIDAGVGEDADGVEATRQASELRREAVREEECGLRAVAGAVRADEAAHTERAHAPAGVVTRRRSPTLNVQPLLDDDLAGAARRGPSTSVYGVSSGSTSRGRASA